MRNDNVVNAKILFEGLSYYSKLDRPNNKGKYPSNCYEVGITEFTAKFPSSYDDNLINDIFSLVIDNLVKDNDDAKYIKIANSKYPIKTYDNNGNLIDEPRIKNDTKFMVMCTVNYSEKYDTYYLTVNGVKLIDDYIVSTPFDNLNDFE